ncbi:MAG: tetratricopeptide repeat protein [Deltaproteobacteria bacterium]
MKKRGWVFSWLVIFVAGFIAGIVFSAWRLDIVGGLSAPPSQSASGTTESQREKRMAGLEKMLSEDPGNVKALIQLGNDYFDSGRYQKAVELYKRALKVQPRNTAVLTDLGVSVRKMGKPRQAVEEFQKALQIDPNQPVALFNLGIVYRDDLKDLPAALKTWERFLETAGDAPYTVMVRPWVKQLREKLGSTGSAKK